MEATEIDLKPADSGFLYVWFCVLCYLLVFLPGLVLTLVLRQSCLSLPVVGTVDCNYTPDFKVKPLASVTRAAPVKTAGAP